MITSYRHLPAVDVLAQAALALVKDSAMPQHILVEAAALRWIQRARAAESAQLPKSAYPCPAGRGNRRCQPASFTKACRKCNWHYSADKSGARTAQQQCD